MASTQLLPSPKPVTASASSVMTGQYVAPIDRIKLFSNSQWEDFVLEWADSLRDNYERVERCGGAGDMGRDVVALAPSKKNAELWDNYQCKHYDHPLWPSDIWIELGKLVYYTFTGEFSYPRKYYFVAPQGAGTDLANLFRRPQRLRERLIENWDAHCRKKITNKKEVLLDDPMKKYINSLDFGIINYIPPLRIIEQHSTTRWYVSRFGGGLPMRPSISPPPENPTVGELGYLAKLLEAYGDYLNREVIAPADIEKEQDIKAHYIDSRIQFYSAESLRSFSRDYLPPGEFQKLQDDVYDGIRDDIRDDHPNGYKRVLAVVKTARSLQLSAHSLNSALTPRDRGGICHQLANDKDEIRWIKK